MGDFRLYSDLTWQDIKACAEKGYIVVLPVGSTEQHGPQLPLRTDDYMALQWAEDSSALAAKNSDAKVLVMPGIHYGNAKHHMAFAGTITLSFETLKALVFEVVDAVITHGFRKIVILNVHGGNRHAVNAAAVDLKAKHLDLRPPLHLRVAEDCDKDLNPLLYEGEALSRSTEEGRLTGMMHGGALETAKILHLRPDLVHMDRAMKKAIPPSAISPGVHFYHELTDNGSTGWPSQATEEAGRIMWNSLVTRFAEYLEKLWRD
jgi:creatinine amidohydrolase